MHKEVLTIDVQGSHAWRQAQTMWNVRNFVRHDANILNPRVSYFNGGSENILRYEFPIFQYSIAKLQKVFGEKVLVFRLFLFALSIVTSFGFFYLIRDIFDNTKTALVATFLFQFSPLFYYYSYNPIPDNLGLCGAIWYVFLMLKFRKSKKYRHLLFASIWLLIATLAKLPFLMFSIVTIYYFLYDLLKGESKGLKLLLFPIIQLAVMIPAFLWYAWVMPTWSGNSVMQGIFDNPLPYEEYWKIIDYHLRIMFPRILLYWSVWLFAIIGLIAIWKHRKLGWLISLILITFLYLILELNTINTVHDYYMIPFLPWLYILIAGGVHFLIKLKRKWSVILIVLALILAPIDTFYSTHNKWFMKHEGFDRDVLKYKEELKNVIPNDELCIILNDKSKNYFSYSIDKMGHIFYNDELPVGWIGDMIDNYGVTHLYSDSRKIDEDPEFEKLVDTLLLKAGSIRVYKLRERTTDSIKFLPDFIKKKDVE